MIDLNETGLSRYIVDNSGVATFLVQQDGNVSYGNAAFQRLLGYDTGEIAGLHIRQLSDQATAEILCGDNAGKADLNPATDSQFLRKDQTSVWVHAISSRLPAMEGEGCGGFIVQLADIERQKQIEVALLLSESRMKFALDAANQGVWDHDSLTDRVYLSESWRRMRGIAPDEHVDGSLDAWLERIHPEDREHIRAAIRRQGADHRGLRIYEYREQHKDGHYIWLQSRGRPVAWDENGNPTRTLGTDTEITERKLADEEIQRLSQRLELALGASKIGVWEQDMSTGRVVWDARMREIYGIKDHDGDLMDFDWIGALHPEDRASAQLAFDKAVAERSHYSSQYRIMLPNGEVRHLRSRANVFTDANGAVRCVGAEWDVTADVVLNEQLHAARALAEMRYTELQEAQAYIHHAALHDYLTDLPNRRFLDQMLREQRALARNRKGTLAILHIDLDYFKEINDTLGHAAGDVMLQHVADVLRACVREGDFVARIGGDEFVVLSWFGGDQSELGLVANRIIRELQGDVLYKGIPMHVGASIGIAYEEADGVDPNQLLREADVALYRAKDLGRNRYEFSLH